MATPDRYDDPFERYSYKSPLIESLRAGNGVLEAGRVTVRAARTFGFCWGVDRAVAMVHDALEQYPGRRIWLLDQIIHNPHVNADLKRQGVHFLRGRFADSETEAELTAEDVVIIPAFSATVEDMQRLEADGCTIVDTTCPWVIKPHKRTIKYVKDGFTTLIHGLVRHEETRASCSLVASRGGNYLVVADKDQATLVCELIRGNIPAERLLAALPPEAASSGFDPELHLSRIGTVNQTTMLASETREIERMVREALAERDGEDAAAKNFLELNTICRATQENQDSVGELAAQGPLDLMIVVGGYDSSNTRNLTRVGEGKYPSYHVDGPDGIADGVITHRCPETGETLQTRDWLPDGEVQVGFTAGASTPDTLLGETIRGVLEVAGAAADVPTR
ncbi:MAG: 4-hydroxy-3-methylbut-2-enyl diphosphate reductase [Planctomycetota bacterium]|jgi:4-hydroxy-3-methylbut-2-enyl diphosphate reductase